MVSSVPPPSLSGSPLAEWTQTDDTTEVLFEMPGVTVAGRTLVYERENRFIFVTRLVFEPSLPSIFHSRVASMVLSAAKQRFTNRLQNRGATAVEYVTPQEHHHDTGSIRIVPFQSTHEDGAAYAGSLAVCRNGTFVLAGGAYPADTEDADEYEATLREIYERTV